MDIRNFIEGVEKRDIDVKFEGLSFINNSKLISKNNIELVKEFLREYEFRPFLNLTFKSNNTNKEKVIMMSLTKDFMICIIECNFYSGVLKVEYSIAKISDIIINNEHLEGVYIPEILEKMNNFENMMIKSINLKDKILYNRCLLKNSISNKEISKTSHITITSIVSKNGQNYFENIFTKELFNFNI